MLIETPSILIADDDIAFRETLRGLLEPRGFHTLTAADDEETLKIVARQPVHLLLLDMHMPRLTGLETVRRIRQFHGLLPASSFLLLWMNQLLSSSLAEVFSVLPKPVSCSEIIRAAIRFSAEFTAGLDECR